MACTKAHSWMGFVVALLTASGCSSGDPTAAQSNLLRGVLWKSPDVDTTAESFWDGSPRVLGDKVFIVRKGYIAALRALDGALVWRRPFAHQSLRGPHGILTSGSMVYAADMDTLFALDASSGASVWSRETSHNFTECEGTIDDRAVYICSDAQRAAAYDRLTGSPLWESVLSPPTSLSVQVYGMARGGDTLYITSRRDLDRVHRFAEITALDRRTGTELWRWSSKDSSNSALGSPVLVGNLLVADDEDGNAIFAVDRFTQREQWRIKGEPGAFGPKGTPSIVGDTVYVASADQYVYAIHAPTGRLLWRTLGGGSYFSTAVCGNKVFANDFGIDIRDRTTGQFLDRILASRENDDYGYSGIGTDGTRIYVSGHTATYAIAC